MQTVLKTMHLNFIYIYRLTLFTSTESNHRASLFMEGGTGWFDFLRNRNSEHDRASILLGGITEVAKYVCSRFESAMSRIAKIVVHRFGGGDGKWKLKW